MPIYDPRYEVAWQLATDESDEALSKAPVDLSSSSEENLGSLARFAGLLSGAEVAAIALCRGEGLIIELTDPPTPWLTPGVFLRARPPTGDEEDWRVEMLLGGNLRWCWCKPPPAFSSAALIGAPALFSSQRLLVVANRDSRLSEVNLGLAASHLAQARNTPSAAATCGRPVAPGAGDTHGRVPPHSNRASGPGTGSEPIPATKWAPPPSGEAGS